MVSSKKGPSSGSGLSKSASTSRAPRRSNPSSATSEPGTKASTRIDLAPSSSTGLRSVRAREQPLDAAPRGDERPGVVGADDAAAAGEPERLQDARVARQRRRRGGAVG